MAESERITIRLSPKDVAHLDRARGPADRSTYLRSLLRSATRKRRATKPPTRAEALALLADHAEFDAQAAIRLAEMVGADEDLARLRELTTDPAD